MTRDFINGDITTEAAFDTALGQLLMEAIRNDIDPRGSWVYRNSQTPPEWEIVIHELAQTNDTE
ncbi:MAG: hypothetical protein ABEH65_03585 [Halobacteriales archaeon]